MKRERPILRRDFLNATAVAGVGALMPKDSPAQGKEPDAARGVPEAPKELPAQPQLRLLADLFVEWQMDVGRMDPRRTRWATW